MRAKADKIERKLIVDRSKLESEVANLRLKSQDKKNNLVQLKENKRY